MSSANTLSCDDIPTVTGSLNGIINTSIQETEEAPAQNPEELHADIT